ncbi:uncharacterized protein LOC130701220 [Daphnia carinata]|uniref:uncharacterized protein LOC130701220 n=1 Tax=Daphnia carinata TaxID=120202 RepID=UPI00257D00A1|nr:uncharacterized protein LOC130701220 [Daphnia carinata]
MVQSVQFLVLLSSVSIFFGSTPMCVNGTLVVHGGSNESLISVIPTEPDVLDKMKSTSQLDLGTCDQQSKVPCIDSGTCETVPLLEPARCRRRYCPLNKVYCLDFDGCMIPDPVFIFALAPKEKKCPIPLSLCADKDLCQFVLRKNYDDLREPSVDRLNCSIMINQIVFTNSSCEIHGDCHWTAKCCPDGGLNRQCVSYDGTIIPARIAKELNASSTTSLTLPSASFNYDQSLTTEPGSASLLNITKSTLIRIMNSFKTTVDGRLSVFELSMCTQLAKLLGVSENVFTKMIVRNGSILLEIEMSPSLVDSPDAVDQAHVQLTSMLRNGTLVLTDLNGTKLDIPPQENGTLLANEAPIFSNIFIGVTAASLGSTFSLVLWVVWNLKKGKTINPIPHSERLNSHAIFINKQSKDNLIRGSSGLGQNQVSKLANFAESQVQWDLFQQHFPGKPDYVWKSHEEVAWAGSDHQVRWPQLLDAPDEESVAIVKKK